MIRVLSYSLLLVSLAIVGPTPVSALDAADLPDAIENAKTAADHEAIAAYFDAEAKAARDTAERHRRMGAAYGKHPAIAGGKAVRSPLHKTMPGHCDELVKSYEAAAKDYEALAAAHREAASGVE